MRSILSTVSRSVKYTPAFSSDGRPLGKQSSMTRYSVSSAFTNGVPATRPSVSSIATAQTSGPRVILSIFDQGKLTAHPKPGFEAFNFPGIRKGGDSGLELVPVVRAVVHADHGNGSPCFSDNRRRAEASVFPYSSLRSPALQADFPPRRAGILHFRPPGCSPFP